MRTALFVVAFCFFFSIVALPAYAQEGVEVAPKQSEILEYPLPYPGILSNHPLYIFKEFRDNLMRALLTSQTQQIEFDVLQSDKYVAMSLAYQKLGMWNLAAKTMQRSLKEMNTAVNETSVVMKNGGTIPGHIMDKLEKSTVKHKELADDLIKESSEAGDGAFKQSSDAFSTLSATVAAMK
jgi:bacterioferritin (cytochrome b1)